MLMMIENDCCVLLPGADNLIYGRYFVHVLAFFVEVCQGMSRYVCQGMSRYVCQGMSRYVKVCQGMPRYVKVC
jgi:hypothetical protein